MLFLGCVKAVCLPLASIYHAKNVVHILTECSVLKRSYFRGSDHNSFGCSFFFLGNLKIEYQSSILLDALFCT